MERDSARIQQQTRGFFPSVSLRPAERALQTIWDGADGEVVGAVEFALAREFMLPLSTQRNKSDYLGPVIAALGTLGTGEAAVFQVLFEPVRAPWSAHALRAVTTPDGRPFFADAPEVTDLAREKLAEPLYAAAVRMGLCAGGIDVAEDVDLGVAGALNLRGDPAHNEFTPLPPEDLDLLVDDILSRTTHRSGMLVSLSDLASLVHLPPASLESEHLLRASRRTKAAPAGSSDIGFVLGQNEHRGETRAVGLTTEERLRHCYIIGASGTGKSTLLTSMAAQDIEAGRGFAILDPHGDLIDDIIARVPDERLEDVIVLDPADEEFPIGFNILSAHSELEKGLLSSDLVAVFRRLSTSFGDQMVTVLGNAVLAFLESDQGGTLIDLRRFLLDKAFRSQFLRSVRDPEVVSYWRNEFPLLKGNPHAPILTRLNNFLRPKIIRHMVAQRDDHLDMRAIMDQQKILLAKLSHGAIGEENSHFLGSLLVARIAQAAMSRQNEPLENRVPFFLYIDEFHHFITPSVTAILSGARKYGLGLILAHQDMRQLKSRSEDVASAVLANAASRVVFRVSDQDAKALADGFSFFKPSDLQNLGVGEAIARIERPECDFNLRTIQLPTIDGNVAAGRRIASIAASRGRYATSREAIEQTLRAGDGMKEEQWAPYSERAREGKSARATSETSIDKHPEAAPLPGRGGPRHKYLQSLVRRVAEARAYNVTVEKAVLGGHGHVDVALERDGLSIACEISVTTRIDHEIGNLTKCLAAGFDYAILVAPDEATAQRARELWGADDLERIAFLVPGALAEFLDQVQETRSSPGGGPVGKGPQPTVVADDKKRLLIARDAALYIGLAQQTLAKMRVTGDSPPFYKVGRQVLYDKADLEAWLCVRRRRSTSDSGEHDRN
jgi:DNA helicase HerA-like ATPase